MPESHPGLSRRLLLRGAATAAVAGGLAAAGASHPARAAAPRSGPAGRVTPGRTSANGWRVASTADGDPIRTVRVPGTGVSVALRGGDVSVVLIHLVRRFHYEVEALRPGEVVGFKPPQAFPARHETNHASGTAVDIRADWYPIGARGGFFPTQLDVVRDILADCDGVVRWGADLDPVDEAHFQIDVPPGDARLRDLAAKIRGWAQRPGTGAGVLWDPLTPARRRRARALHHRQRVN